MSDKPPFSNMVIINTTNKLLTNFPHLSNFVAVTRDMVESYTAEKGEMGYETIGADLFHQFHDRIIYPIKDEIINTKLLEFGDIDWPIVAASHIFMNIRIFIELVKQDPLLYDAETSIRHIIIKNRLFSTRRPGIYHISNLEKEDSYKLYYLALKWFYMEGTKNNYPANLLAKIERYETEELPKHPELEWKSRYSFPRIRQ